MKARGYYTKNSKNFSQVLPVIKEVINNDLSNCKILKEGEYDNNSSSDSCCCNIFWYSKIKKKID